MAILDAALVEDLKNIKADDGNFAPIPVGDYTLQVNATELKQTRDGSGQFIKVEFSVVAPSHQGRKLFTNFNIYNRNPEAERIGRSQFKAFNDACGIPPVQDTDELCGHVVLAHVTIEKDKTGRYDDQNRLSKFRRAESAPSVAAAPAPAPIVPPSGGSFAAAFSAPSPSSSDDDVPDFGAGFVFK